MKTKYLDLADVFLEEGRKSAEELADAKFKEAGFTAQQVADMKQRDDYKARINAMSIDNALVHAAETHNSIARVVLHILFLGERDQVYRGFLKNGEEYNSLEEWADVKIGNLISEDMLKRYCRTVQDMLIPIYENPPALSKEHRIHDRKKQVSLLASEDGNEEKIARLNQEIESIDSGMDISHEFMTVDSLIDNTSNMKLMKEMPYSFNLAREADRDDLANSIIDKMYLGESYAKVRTQSDAVRIEIDAMPQDGNETIVSKPVLHMENLDNGDIRISGTIPDWLLDQIVAVFNGKVDFRFAGMDEVERVG